MSAEARTKPAARPGRKRVTVLGSTGSVGTSTLDLISGAPDRFEVVALSAHSRSAKLIEQAKAFRPAFVAIGDTQAAAEVRGALEPLGIEVGVGEGALIEAAAREADWVMAAIVGSAGLKPTLRALEQGSTVALANKECLVCAGPLFLEAARRNKAALLPVDSEHNAIFQVLNPATRAAVDRLILTASGGPFRTADRAAMARATPAEAVAHPRWSMGAKISVDSATMMNKGLEIIEASYLFDMPGERIDVLVHPQSVVHSLVAYIDGSVLAQLGTPDMRTPIAHALAWPDRMAAPADRLNLAAIGALTFEQPDEERFPALNLARASLAAGGAAPTVLNAANEVAVAAFLKGRIGFLDIVTIVNQTMQHSSAEFDGRPPRDLGDIWHWDARARAAAESFITRRK